MCELLGMSANVPTDICFSFLSFMHRGGRVGPHKDGWGLTFYDGKGCRTFKDAQPCYSSPIAQLLKDYAIKSRAVIGHIRQANSGEVSLENTHPFTRELWGKYWTFAHNGQIKGFRTLPVGRFQPVGETDSERIFCWLLHELSQRYARKPANWLAVFRFVAARLAQFAPKGICNVILSDGEYVMAHCATHLHWITRRAPFGLAKLVDDAVAIDFSHHTSKNDVVTIFATQPLTENEHWHKIPSQQFVLFRYGEQVI